MSPEPGRSREQPRGVAGDSYRAAVIVGPNRIELQPRSIAAIAPQEVVARVDAAGICGTDLSVLDGTLPYLATGLMKFPVIAGHEWSGRVIAIGSEVTLFRVGDRVTSEVHVGCQSCHYCLIGRYNLCPRRARLGLVGLDGAMADVVVVPERTVHRVPDAMDADTAALIEPATIAFSAIDKVAPVGGFYATVLGAGPVGLLATILLRALGAAWINVVDPQPMRRDAAALVGADAVVDPRRRNLQQVLGRGHADNGSDIVIEATGDPGSLAIALAVVAPGGHVALISMYKSRANDLPVDLVVSKEVTIHGNLASPGVWDRTIGLLAASPIDFSSLVSHHIPLEEVPRAFEIARDRSLARKVLVMPN